MIEHIPQIVEKAFFYFHSAGTNATELEPYLHHFIEKLPHTYIWIGDGVISDSPFMREKLNYNNSSEKRYWFTFPMDDASSPESFQYYSQAIGASLSSSSGFVNSMVDQVKAKFSLTTDKIVLCGFQHGSSLVLSTAMMRKKDPFSQAVLIEPYILEAYYLADEKKLPSTAIYCIDNKHIRERTKDWLNVKTDKELDKMGVNTKKITIKNGGDELDISMIVEVINVVNNI